MLRRGDECGVHVCDVVLDATTAHSVGGELDGAVGAVCSVDLMGTVL